MGSSVVTRRTSIAVLAMALVATIGLRLGNNHSGPFPSASDIRLATKTAQEVGGDFSQLPACPPWGLCLVGPRGAPTWSPNVESAVALITTRQQAQGLMSESAWHDPTSYYHGSYVILVRIAGTFIHYAPSATERNPTVATDASILAALSPLDGRVLDSEIGKNLPEVSSLGVARLLYQRTL